MLMKQCPICTLSTLIPHDPDGRDCLRGWTETTYAAADLLLTQTGCREVPTASRSRWPSGEEFKRRLRLAHQRLAAWEALYQHIAGILREADLPVPGWEDPDLPTKLLADIQVMAIKRFQEGKESTEEQ